MCMQVQHSPQNIKIQQLNKEATQLKKYGNISAAIENLKQVHSLMLDSPCHSIEAWLRLPKFLQAAGRFDEAVRVLEDVIGYAIDDKLNPIPENALGACEHAKEALKHRNLVNLYKGKQLVCKRENRLDLVADCEEKVRYHAGESARLKPIVEQEINERSEKYRARREVLIKSKKI